MPLRLTSAAFRQGGDIPKKYTCDGDNVSPPFAWSGAGGHAQLPAYLRRSGRARRNIPPLGRLRHSAGLAGPKRGARRGKSDEWLSSSHQQFGQAGLLGSLSAARGQATPLSFPAERAERGVAACRPFSNMRRDHHAGETPYVLEFVELVGFCQRSMKHEPRRLANDNAKTNEVLKPGGKGKEANSRQSINDRAAKTRFLPLVIGTASPAARRAVLSSSSIRPVWSISLAASSKTTRSKPFGPTSSSPSKGEASLRPSGWPIGTCPYYSRAFAQGAWQGRLRKDRNAAAVLCAAFFRRGVIGALTRIADFPAHPLLPATDRARRSSSRREKL